MHIHVKSKTLRSPDCINCLYNKDVAYEINRSRFSNFFLKFFKISWPKSLDQKFALTIGFQIDADRASSHSPANQNTTQGLWAKELWTVRLPFRPMVSLKCYIACLETKSKECKLDFGGWWSRHLDFVSTICQ